MKICKLAIVHLIGAIMLALTIYAFYNSYVYSSFAFLQNIATGPYTSTITQIIESSIYLSTGLFTVFKVDLKKDKLYVAKKVLTFIASIVILNIIFKVIFYVSWAILIGIYGY